MSPSEFWERVDVGGPDECWPWKLSIGSHGYGQAFYDNHVTVAHRVSWTLTNGEIPAGMTVDHICRNRPCVNPSHLRLLTNQANATDNGQGRKTHCPAGHPYDQENTYLTPGRRHRRCRTCGRVLHRAWLLAHKAVA